MIIAKYKGSVADWWYEIYSQPAPHHTRADLRQLLDLCQSTLAVLEKHDLLLWPRICFYRWLSVDQNSGEATLVDEPDLVIDLSTEKGADTLLARCERALDDLEAERPFLYPGRIDVDGKGIVYAEDGESQLLSDVVWLRCLTLTHHIVQVNTQCDAWLPYTLRGEPQPKTWEQNAPRFETALQEIQDQLGTEPHTDDVTDYAIIKGFRLENHTDADGEIVEVIHDEES